MGGLSGDLEGDAVGGLALHLEGGSGDMVEVLVQQLQSSVSLLTVLNIMAHAVAALGRKEEKYLFASSYIVGQLGDIGEGWDGHDCGL